MGRISPPLWGLVLGGKAEVSLALILGTDYLASINKLTDKGGHSLVGEVSALGHRLDDFGDGIQPIDFHVLQNGGLDTSIGGLLGGGFILGRVLLSQQFHLMRHELGQHRVGLNVIQLGQHLELLHLGHLLVFHSINLHFSLLGCDPCLILFSLRSVLIIAHLVEFVKWFSEKIPDFFLIIPDTRPLLRFVAVPALSLPSPRIGLCQTLRGLLAIVYPLGFSSHRVCFHSPWWLSPSVFPT